MDKIVVIRHGEAEHMLTGTVGGWTDTKLTERGKAQALQTGHRLSTLLNPHADDVAFYCSDLKRTRETADIIGQVLDVPPLARPELRDLNNGIAANKTQHESKSLALPKTEPLLDWVRYPERGELDDDVSPGVYLYGGCPRQFGQANPNCYPRKYCRHHYPMVA